MNATVPAVNTTVPSAPSLPRSIWSKRTLAVLGSLVVALLTTLVGAAPANAAYYAGSAGRPGSVTVNGPMVNVYDIGMRLSNGTTFYSKSWVVGGFTVTRSPSSYSQRVTGVSTVQRWDGRWVDIQSRTWNATVSGNGSVYFPTWTWAPNEVPNNRKGYRVNFQIAWTDWSSGQLLAYTAILPNTYADNRCSTKYLPCSSYTDGVNF